MTLQAIFHILNLFLQNENSLLNDKNPLTSIHGDEIYNQEIFIVSLINSIHNITTFFIIHCFLNQVDKMMTRSFNLMKIIIIHMIYLSIHLESNHEKRLSYCIYRIAESLLWK